MVGMNLLDYTHPDGFLPGIEAGSIEEAVTSLVNSLGDALETGTESEIVQEVLRREREGSTAVGSGLLIPHARHEGVKKVRIAVATLGHGLEIPSEDNLPVDVVILLLGPMGDARQMLRVLARLARIMKNPTFLDGIRHAPDAEALRLALSAD